MLGIALFEDNIEAIRDAAEQRMAHVRSYQLGAHSALSQKILNELAAAKGCLLAPKRKAAYDTELKARSASQSSRKAAGADESLAFLQEPTAQAKERKSSKSRSAETPSPATSSTKQEFQLDMRKWAIIGGSIAGVVLLVIVLAVVFRGGVTKPELAKRSPGSVQPVSSEREGHPEPEPKSPPTSPAPPSDSVPVAATQALDAPPEPAATPAPAVPTTSEPSPNTTPPVSSSAESASQARARLEQALKDAKTPSEFQSLGSEALLLAERAFEAGDKENGKAIATVAIVASRSSGDTDLMRKAALVFLRGGQSKDDSRIVKSAATMSAGEVRQFQHASKVMCVAFSPDGRFAASGGDEMELVLWDVTTGEAKWRANRASLAVEFSEDGQKVYSCGMYRLFEFAVATGTEGNGFDVEENDGWNTCFSGGCRYLATNKDGTIRIYDVRNQSVVGKVEAGGTLTFAPNSDLLILDGHQLRRYSIATRSTTPLCRIEQESRIDRMSVSPDGRLLVTGSFESIGGPIGNLPGDNMVRTWDMRTGRELHALQDHNDWLLSVVFSPDGQRVLSAGGGTPERYYKAAGRTPVLDTGIRLWDVNTGKLLQRFEGHEGPVQCVRFSPDGRYALSASADKTVRLWRLP